LPAAKHGEAELRIDGVDGDMEFLGDHLVGQALKAAQHENFAAAVRERGHSLVENFDFLIIRDSFGGIGTVLYHGQLFDIPQALRRGDTVAAGEIEGDVARGDEQVGAYLLELSGDLGAQEARIGFLDQVIRIGNAGEAPAEVGAKGALVRLHFFGEPLRMINGDKLTKA